MMGVSWRRAAPLKTSTPSALRVARTCYDHLAGEVAVKIYAFMMREGWIARPLGYREITITPHGAAALQQHFDIVRS